MTGSLRHLRFPVEESRGRRYPELPHPYRNDFQRDRDRIVHSRAFRRLEDKTQVFSLAIDHLRNRLTHTIEVAQVTRTVAHVLGLDEDFAEALALGHDIGHPPFAHAGEQEIDAIMRRFGERFDHNLHALEIVERFEQRYAAFPGLNLTFEMREGIVKHSRDLTPGASPYLEEYLPHLRPPLEAQLIDLTDEIAYNSADLDDAYGAAMFSFDDAASAVPAFAELRDAVETQFPAAPERLQFAECVRRLMDLMVTALVERVQQAARDAQVRNVDDVRQFPHRLAVLAEPARKAAADVKAFLHTRVYDAPALVAERNHSRRMVSELFEHYLRHPDRLPQPYVDLLGSVPLHHVVRDYIAGMTDGFFVRTFRAQLPSSDLVTQLVSSADRTP